MTPAKKLLIVTLIRLAKGVVGAFELWFCQETGQKLPSHWANQREIGLEMSRTLTGEDGQSPREESRT